MSTVEDSLVAAARRALDKAERAPVDVMWLSAVRRPGSQSPDPVFPSAQWLGPGNDLPPGDLFLLGALVDRLEKGNLALLLSQGPQQSGLVTLLERI